MLETATALLFAHVLADFVLQTGWINRNKARPHVLLLHVAIVGLASVAALGSARPELLALVAAHGVIDAIKTYGRFRSLGAFLLDQGAHLLTIGALALWLPDLWQGGLWAASPALLPLMAWAAGLIVTLRAGEFAIGLLMAPHGVRIRNNGLKNGGRLIGNLERGLIFLLIALDQPLGVGFLVAAKSILRFGTATRDQRTAEYVIIGTLASFGWAIVVSYATAALLSHLPPLEIIAPSP